MADDDLGPLSAPTVLSTGGPGAFRVEVDGTSGMVMARLCGELDMAAAPRLAGALDRALDTRPSALVVDLSELTFADSSGLRVLVTVHHRAERQGCKYTFRSPTRAVLRVLQLTGIDLMVDIELAPGAD